jgi:hypothetical protein
MWKKNDDADDADARSTPAAHAHHHLLPTTTHSLRLYNGLVERCFKDCVSEFRSKNLDKPEEQVRETRANCERGRRATTPATDAPTPLAEINQTQNSA